MLTKKYKFESEVHLGILGIIFLLLFVNFFSNTIIYKARTMSREETLSRLRSSAVAVSRVVQANFPQGLSSDEIQTLQRQFKLSSITMVPSRPADDSPESRRRWFASIVHSLPAGHVSDFAEKLLNSDYSQATKGNGNEYFFVYPIPAGAGRNLIIVSMDNPTLAYLDGSSVAILRIGLATLLILSLAYLLVSRYIFSPFRKIKEKARQAGRAVDEGSSDVMSVVAEYQNVIDELKANETKLLRLNEEINRHAGSLERFNEYLLTSIASGIITLDTEGNVRSMNRAAEDILGRDGGCVEDVRYTDLFPPDSEPAVCLESAVVQREMSAYRELTVEQTDGTRTMLGMAVSAIRDHDDNEVGISVLINDLTELNRLREEVEAKHRLAAMGEMAGGLAHQLRNSLGAIAGYGRLARRKLDGAGLPAGSIDSLLDETDQAAALIRQFLDFTRPFSLSPTIVAVDELLAEIVESFNVRQGHERVEIEVEQVERAQLEIDPLLLKQAVANLIDNAISAYAQGQGTVRLLAVMGDDGYRITVSDTGCGIPEVDRDKIFTPFFSSKPSGTGLGLPLTGKIVDLHGGRITLNSHEGEGTSFTIILPMSLVRLATTSESQTHV